MTVTKAELDALRAAQPKLNTELHYTLGGYAETQVYSSSYAEWTGNYNRTARTLQQAHLQLRRDMSQARHAGYAKTQFNQTHDPTP